MGLRSHPEVHYVVCSFGSVPCPTVQEARHGVASLSDFWRAWVAMATRRRPRQARAVVILVIAGTATIAILAGAWYYLEDWSFFVIVLLLALFGDDVLGLLLLSGKTENAALTGKEAMIGQIATVIEGFAPAVGLRTVCGKVRWNGELWSAESDCQEREGLAVGRKVRIRSVEGLTLIVEPEEGGGADRARGDCTLT